MKTYVFYDALIKNQDGKIRGCLLKFPADKKLSDLPAKDLYGVGSVEVFSRDDLHRIEIFARDEVRIMGNGPITNNLLRWYRGAALKKIKKIRHDAKEFFKASKLF